MNAFLELCQNLNIPVSLEKTVFASTLVVFLGILLNGEDYSLSVPTDKRNKAIALLNLMIDKKKVLVKDLQGLCVFKFPLQSHFSGKNVYQMYVCKIQ